MRVVPNAWKKMVEESGFQNIVSLIHIGIGFVSIFLAPVAIGSMALLLPLSLTWLVLHSLLIVAGGVVLILTGHYTSLVVLEGRFGLNKPSGYGRLMLTLLGWVLWGTLIAAGLGQSVIG